MDRDLRSGRDDCRAHLLLSNVVEQVERTRHAGNSLARHVGVDHRRFQAFVPQQQLNRADVDAALDQVRRKAVPESVAMNGAIKSGRDAGAHDRALQGAVKNVVPPHAASSGTFR